MSDADRPAIVPPPPPSAPEKSHARLIAEAVVDVIAIAATTALAFAGKVPGELALAVIGVLAGVRLSDLVAARSGGSGPPSGGAGGVAGAAALLLSLALGAGRHLVTRVGLGHATMAALA